MVIGLTAYGMNDETPDGSGLNNRQKCLRVGMDDYVTKPVSIEELKAAIQRWFPAEAKPPELGANFAEFDGSISDEVNALATAIDLEHLTKITTGNLELQQQLLELFIEQAQSNLENAEKAWETGETDIISANAHQLKGASANLGAIAIPTLAAKLERFAEDNNLDGAIVLITQLKQKLEQLQEAIASSENLPQTLTNAIAISKLPSLTRTATADEKIPIDFDRLQKLSRGNTAFERTLLQTFVQQFETYLEEAIAALEAKNYLNIARNVDQIKGASQNVGILMMPDIASQIAAQVEQNNFTGIPEQMHQLQHIHQQVKTFVTALGDFEDNRSN